MRRSVQILAVVAGAAAAAAGVLAARSATASSPPPSAPAPPAGGSTSSDIQPAPAPGAEDWTPERMRGAEPAPMPRDDG